MTMGREDGVPGSFADEQQQYQLMRALLERYGTFTGVDSEDHRPVLAADSPVPPINTRSHDADGSLIVLTGTTGALGAHILFQLLTTTDLHVVAPVRASGGGAEHAMQRVRESLLVRKLRLPPAVARDFANRVSALPCAFAQADLGIGSDAYRRLLMHAVAVIHAPVTSSTSPSIPTAKPASSSALPSPPPPSLLHLLLHPTTSYTKSSPAQRQTPPLSATHVQNG
ncbi:hypothetical protein PHLCEN_2v2429 [Hermanssonia centrifuga]|uniref:Thioester reductase (TE) domain-containing protein n=1 Tax=Hermanssonia centrifuga TaxID=98765 RepID=A0A2R6RLW8_9APHY|nr:hypothetical protein PHLCEN_2v2429 [Hermanssonia centrifuga]